MKPPSMEVPITVALAVVLLCIAIALHIRFDVLLPNYKANLLHMTAVLWPIVGGLLFALFTQERVQRIGLLLTLAFAVFFALSTLLVGFMAE